MAITLSDDVKQALQGVQNRNLPQLIEGCATSHDVVAAVANNMAQFRENGATDWDILKISRFAQSPDEVNSLASLNKEDLAVAITKFMRAAPIQGRLIERVVLGADRENTDLQY